MAATNPGVCECCGRTGYVLAKTETGHIHFGCWGKHHSDPTGPWPEGHVCKRDQPQDEEGN